MDNLKPTHFFTWSDVQNCISSAPSTSWQHIDIDASGVFIYGEDEDKIKAELSRKLDAAYNQRENTITLVGTNTKLRQLPVEILPAEDAPDWPEPPKRPLWLDRRHIKEDERPSPSPDSPKVAAFFSFKGGVGRTTACFATAIRLLSNVAKVPRILYVDADLEAPGLTWMTEDAPEGNTWSSKLELGRCAGFGSRFGRLARRGLADHYRADAEIYHLPGTGVGAP